MITRNGDIIFGMVSFGMAMITHNSNNRIRNINNSTCYATGSSLSNMYLYKIANPIDFTTNTTTSSSGLFLWIGNGDTITPLSKYNYDLGNRYDIADLGIGTQTITFDNNGRPIVSAIFTNDTQSSMIINEVGLFGKTPSLNIDDSEDTTKILLLGRELITATTLEPNTSIKVNFKLSIS